MKPRGDLLIKVLALRMRQVYAIKYYFPCQFEGQRTLVLIVGKIIMIVEMSKKSITCCSYTS